jgi:phosphatidylethanolamine-binding protein (PEBP) family uncharacterized protein
MIPARYTCGGSNTSLPLAWTHVPAHTAELVVYAVEPVRTPKGSKHRALVQWAIAGLSPQLHGIAAGKLPPGAIVGRNSVEHKSAYSICTEKGKIQPYLFLLFALPHRLSLTPGFDAGRLYPQVNYSAVASSSFVAVYKRK